MSKPQFRTSFKGQKRLNKLQDVTGFDGQKQPKAHLFRLLFNFASECYSLMLEFLLLVEEHVLKTKDSNLILFIK